MDVARVLLDEAPRSVLDHRRRHADQPAFVVYHYLAILGGRRGASKMAALNEL